MQFNGLAKNEISLEKLSSYATPKNIFFDNFDIYRNNFNIKPIAEYREYFYFSK